jgi:hypothetical protein
VHKTVRQRQDGYKGHIAVEPDTGIFTAVELAKASGEDNSETTIGLRLLEGEPPGAITQVLGDSYGTGEMRDALATPDQSRTAVIKPPPLLRAVPGGFTIDNFEIDHENQQATCPAGHTRPIYRNRRVVFGRLCTSCPLREQCSTSPRGRQLTLHPKRQAAASRPP